MTKVTCVDCGSKGKPSRTIPIYQFADGSEGRICRKCWFHYDYAPFLQPR